MKLTRKSTWDQSGFGLVELMIAMTIGLILLGGIGYLYLGSRAAFRTTDNLSRMQENARFALDMMSRDIRMAGYLGCGNLQSARINTIANPPVPSMTLANALIGYDNGSGWANPSTVSRAAGDVISIMAAWSSGVNLVGNVTPQNANIQVGSNPDSFQAGDVLVVTNCVNADVFRATSVSTSGGTIITLAHSSSSNSSNWVGSYGHDAFVMRVNQYSYFIGTNAAGNRALYRVGVAGNAEELVENVWDLQIRYGLDTNGDGAVDTYSTTPASWPQVVSVNLNLLMRSPDDNISTSTQAVRFNNDTFNAPDRRLYQVYSATVGVRNRIPPM